MKKQIIFTCIFLFAISCSQNQVVDPQNESAVSEKKEPKRFFCDESFWNQPIHEDAEIDLRSDKWIKMLKQEPTGEHFGITCNKWTVPIFEVKNNTIIAKINFGCPI